MPPPPLLPTYSPHRAAVSSPAVLSSRPLLHRSSPFFPQAVCEEYDRMRAAIRNPGAREPTGFTQPWLAFPPVLLE